MMYLSNFNNNGAIDLKAGQFSNTNVALIGANCDKSAWQISLAGEVEPGGSLTFDVGVPFDFNHSNPLTAMAPLNVSEMFWSWQLGHKFLRLDLATDFSFHLGSTGCKSPSRVRTPIEQCEQPNRFTFKIDNFDRNKAIVFDIDALLKNVSTEQSCMSDPSNPVCASLFSNLKKPIFYQE